MSGIDQVNGFSPIFRVARQYQKPVELDHDLAVEPAFIEKRVGRICGRARTSISSVSRAQSGTRGLAAASPLSLGVLDCAALRSGTYDCEVSFYARQKAVAK